MRLIEKIIIGGILLISYFAAVNTFLGSELDWKCKLFINNTHLEEDEKPTYISKSNKLQKCFNDTIRSTKLERNLTKYERSNCFLKCHQINDGRATDDGSISPKLSELIENIYKKYTNATPSYIKKVDSIHTRCANEAKNTIKSLQKNGTDIAECALNGFYFDCCSDAFRKQFKNYYDRNTTTEELRKVCGDQIGIKI